MDNGQWTIDKKMNKIVRITMFLNVLSASSILLLISASSVLATLVAKPELYKITYQFCIPQEVLNKLNYHPLLRGGNCTISATSYIWGNEPPVAKLFWTFNPGKLRSNDRNNDRYETRIKGLGCENIPQQLGWYMGGLSPYIDDRFSKETPELSLVQKVEKVNTASGQGLLLPIIQSCQLRQPL